MPSAQVLRGPHGAHWQLDRARYSRQGRRQFRQKTRERRPGIEMHGPLGEAPFGSAKSQEVRQRACSCRGNIGVFLEVPLRIEFGTRWITGALAYFEIMNERIFSARAQFRMPRHIPRRIEHGVGVPRHESDLQVMVEGILEDGFFSKPLCIPARVKKQRKGRHLSWYSLAECAPGSPVEVPGLFLDWQTAHELPPSGAGETLQKQRTPEALAPDGCSRVKAFRHFLGILKSGQALMLARASGIQTVVGWLPSRPDRPRQKWAPQHPSLTAWVLRRYRARQSTMSCRPMRCTAHALAHSSPSSCRESPRIH